MIINDLGMLDSPGTTLIKLPAIDIINAIDFRMENLKEKVASAIEKLPEKGDELQGLIAEMIEAGKARRAIARHATYLVTKDVTEAQRTGAEK
ncbi:hypothetical protein [Enterobacter hormaechei]|uniref:hypothetical protein n=1 Tax=Enterobacter hormaechei TaxID=158836 RepID=UPI00137741A7|nr:hypothetical protein [Enterobacter hormaechei]NBF24579.1 hypothetical protein [Enterobacter hormaechei]HCZ4695641.1 hypothetical protein [Salmonella enterica subsp. enterica serovar Saintpaul str. CFSAN004147]HCZ5289066.1 hypothetical protein [Salmonella enterica subsp. enterica serovar Saintpaul str. CFSAN004154]